MLNINRATLLGHAGRDPEIRNLQNGGKAASFTLATTEKMEGQGRQARREHRMAPDSGLRTDGGSGGEDAEARATRSWSRGGSRRAHSATRMATTVR